MSHFVAETSFVRVAPLRYRGQIGGDWAQGRGALGGLVAAILARALEDAAPNGLRLTTLTTAFLLPATAGPAEVTVELVRVGRNVATARASLVRDDAVLATALATLTRPRDAALAHDALPAPAVPAPEDVPDGPDAHYYPGFARRFSFRQCLGSPPFEGATTNRPTEARIGGWCRLEEPDAAVDRAQVVTLLDAWPPAATALSPGWCPVASIELTCHFLVDLPHAGIAPGSWLLFDARSRHVGGGLCDETATLWSRDGRALATARQLIAIFPVDAAARPTRRYGG